MKIYLDVIFAINFIFDFLLLLTVKIILKREIKLRRLLLAAFSGGLSIFALFVPISSITLFIFKVLISCLMILISFGRKDFTRNFLYLYFVSILLGGFLYFINDTFSYKNTGLIFFHNGFSLNLLALALLGPIILYLYLKQINFFATVRPHLYPVTLCFLKKTFQYQAFLDTGNALYDPYSHKPVLLLYDPSFPVPEQILYVPYETLSGSGLLSCIKIDSIKIGDKTFSDVLVGLAKEPFHLKGVELLLHSDFLK